MHQLHSSHLTICAFTSEKERFPAPPPPPHTHTQKRKKKVLGQKQFTGQAPSLASFVRSPPPPPPRYEFRSDGPVYLFI